jgi:predicted TPR repeat methyltransferase
MKKPSFDSYSTYYDLFYQDKPYQQEAASIVKGIQYYLPKAHTLLDMGCGTGIHARHFQQAGFSVQGVDLSVQMIEIARRRSDGILYHVEDARSFKLPASVDVVTLLFHVMSYQTSNEDVESTLRACAANLNPDGLLFFDVWHAPAVLMQQPERRTKVCEAGGTRVTRQASPAHNELDRTVEVRYDIEVCTPKSCETFTEHHLMRYFSFDEVKSFLDSAGFDLLEAKELITDASPSESTWGILYVAQKR